MKFLLDTPISAGKRAIQFSNASSSAKDESSAEKTSEGAKDGWSMKQSIVDLFFD